jgi:glycosyltransferase involved in cell wall biosynthesis
MRGGLRAISVLCKFAYKSAKHIVAQSQGIATTLIQRGVDPAKITRIYNWATYQALQNDILKVPEKILRDFSGKFNIIYGGNLGQAQALETLIEAAFLASQKAPKIFLHLIGDGIDRAQLSNFVTRKGFKNTIVHDALPRDVMDRVFDLADVLALHLKPDPLYDITIPSKIQHYLSCGKPIIAGLRGEAARLLEESGAAIVCSPQDAQKLAEAMIAFAEMTPSERARVGNAGKLYYDRTMSFESAMSKTLQIIRSVATEKGS